MGGRIGSRFLAWLRELLPAWDNSNSTGSNKSTPRPLQAGAAGEYSAAALMTQDALVRDVVFLALGLASGMV